MKKLKCIRPNWQTIMEIAKNTCVKIKQKKFKPELIVAIARGGLVPARLFADELGIKDIISIKADHWGITATMDGNARISYGVNTNLKRKNILLVDDVTDTGQSMNLAKQHLNHWNAGIVKTATLHNLKDSKHVPDFYGKQIAWHWIIFPWNATEDLVNLTHKAMEGTRMVKKSIQKKLYAAYGIRVNEKEVIHILNQIKYLERK